MLVRLHVHVLYVPTALPATDEVAVVTALFGYMGLLHRLLGVKDAVPQHVCKVYECIC